MNNTQKGLIAILICYLSWGLFPIYFKLLMSIPEYEVLSHRILLSFLFMLIVILFTKNKKTIIKEINFVLKDKKTLLFLSAASILIALNWLIYIIAVNTNHVLEASFGYYLNPIVTILLAVIFLREKLNRVQIIACSCVALSLIYLLVTLGSLPWISITLALSFGFYGLCKKKVSVSPKTSLLIETAIVSPLALCYTLYLTTTSTLILPSATTITIILILLSGAITAIPLMLFASATRYIPLYLLGILQYIPPTMQFLIGVFLYNEQLSTEKLISFSIIWIAVIVFCYATIIEMKKKK